MRRLLAAGALGALLSLALGAVQAAVSRHLWGGTLPLALPLTLIAWAALEERLLEGIAWALGVGYVLDLFAGTPKGLLVFLSVLALLALRTARSSLAVHGAAGFAALAGAATALVGTGAVLLTRLTAAAGTAPSPKLLGRVLLESLVTAAAALLLRPLLLRLGRLLPRDPETGVLLR